MSDDISLLELFREEVRTHCQTLVSGLVELENHPNATQAFEPLMRAAHSIKGASRLVQIEAAVRLAHEMEDIFVAAQNATVCLGSAEIDLLLHATDLLQSLAHVTEASQGAWGASQAAQLEPLLQELRGILHRRACSPEVSSIPTPPTTPTLMATVDAISQPPTPPTISMPAEPELDPESPLWELFRDEVRQAVGVLQIGLQQPTSELGPLLQAARTIRSAARLLQLNGPAEFGQLLEQILSRLIQQGEISAEMRQRLHLTVGVLLELTDQPPSQIPAWNQRHLATLRQWLEHLPGSTMAPLAAASQPNALTVPLEPPPARLPVGPALPQSIETPPAAPAPGRATPIPEEKPAEAVVRVSAESLTRLMSLAGESLVQARWLSPFATALLKLKKAQDHLAALLESAQVQRDPSALSEARRQLNRCRSVLAERMREFEDHAARAEDLNARLYREVIASRMRPFSDGAIGFPRLVRDMARSLDKQVRLEIQGLNTEVDRDILERLEAPLNHLLRNAVDHGIESVEQRRQAGKPEQGTIRLDVRHRAGMLVIQVSDDGRGIDVEQLRIKIVDKGLTTSELAATLTEAELLEFLFLPGFTTAGTVTEYSGRGVGLDVVQTTIRKIGGQARVSTRLGQGTTFHLILPLTLSVVRAVLVEVAGEPYAFPHNRIDRVLRVHRKELQSLEHRQFIRVDGQHIGLVHASQLFDMEGKQLGDDFDILLLSDDSGSYGLIVEAVRGEQDLVVRPLDPRLGKVPDVSAAAILDDGQPVLIADVEDLIRSMELFIQSGTLRRCETAPVVQQRRVPRVLVVDDSITVREVERQLLRNAGYEVRVAVDGMDGWNMVRESSYDLVVSDIDMPRMTGLELLRNIRSEERLRDLPVIIVSYKDRPEDKKRGLELGANAYLTKSSFHDDTFLQTVADLIGEG
ncbi:MAG: hybrid sensor histidine kinase/response regulator [Gemmataceae bacterium]